MTTEEAVRAYYKRALPAREPGVVLVIFIDENPQDRQTQLFAELQFADRGIGCADLAK
jgi:hypothetical protein